VSAEGVTVAEHERPECFGLQRWQHQLDQGGVVTGSSREGVVAQSGSVNIPELFKKVRR